MSFALVMSSHVFSVYGEKVYAALEEIEKAGDSQEYFGRIFKSTRNLCETRPRSTEV